MKFQSKIKTCKYLSEFWTRQEIKIEQDPVILSIHEEEKTGNNGVLNGHQ